MPFPLTVGDIFVTKVWCQDAGQASVNRVYSVVTSVGTLPATDLDVAVQTDTTMGMLMPLILNNNATYRGTQVQIVSNPPLTIAAESVAGAGPGTGGATSLPKQICGLISVITPLSGVRYRGRLYLPFPSTAMDVGDGKPTASYQLNAVNVGDAFFLVRNVSTAGRTATWNQVILHKPGKSAVPPPTIISSFDISGAWATQRRRGDFGRLNESPI
jgi:hypothetical protein